jgi:acetyl-CoA acetyltransferase
MHPFGRHEGVSGMEQGAAAVRSACADAGVEWKDIQFAFGGSMAAGAPDTMVSQLGLTGIQFINVINGCATGGSALFSAYNSIMSGAFDLGIAVGFDKHERGAFRIESKAAAGRDWYGGSGMALTTQFFGMKINRYMDQYGITQKSLAKVASKAFRNGSMNPNAWRRQALTEDEVLSLSIEHSAGPTIDASKAAFEMAGIGPEDVDVAQLQDTESGAEVMHMAENGFCEHGEQEQMLANGETEIGGRFPVNTDGGCLANGEPVGASGLRQVYEVALQLRGDAGERQVPNNPKVGYTHVYGAPGISGVNILST